MPENIFEQHVAGRRLRADLWKEVPKQQGARTDLTKFILRNERFRMTWLLSHSMFRSWGGSGVNQARDEGLPLDEESIWARLLEGHVLVQVGKQDYALLLVGVRPGD